MGNLVTIIVTGAGAPGIVGTIYSLKNNSDNMKFKIISIDVKEDVVGKYLSDEFYVVPPAEDDTYVDIIKKIAEKTNAKVILPQTTKEVMVLSQNKEKFRAIGVNIVVSDYNNILIANDKFLLLEKSKEIGIPYPKYYLVNSKNSFLEAIEKLGFPHKKVVVKPRLSSGMRGFRIITSEKWNLNRFLNEKPEGIEIDLSSFIEIFHEAGWPEILVTEYLPGDEYSVDVFRDGKNVIIIPRLRKSIRSGITFEAHVKFREDLINFSQKLSESLNLDYCFGFQFKLSEEGIPKILECNPRVQGTMVVSTFAGFNMVYYAVKKALGLEVSLSHVNLKEIKFKRYWGGIAIEDEKFIGRV